MIVKTGALQTHQCQTGAACAYRAAGMQNKEIAEPLGVGHVQVSRWRERYAQSRLAGIEGDLPRGAPPVKADAARWVELTTQTKPVAATHWSTRKMAVELGVSASTVMRYWHAHGLKPHIVRGFKVSRDSPFVEKLEDIVGLYISPPEHALVLCCDEKSQVQALDRTQHPGLLEWPGALLHRASEPGLEWSVAMLFSQDVTQLNLVRTQARHDERRNG
ncbi:MAG: helix-turn-helix domain-containing protein [Chromatocurvus sp.]